MAMAIPQPIVKPSDLGGNVSFDDDGPSINISVTDGNTILLNTQDADTEGTATDTDSTSFAAAFTLTSSDYGADGAGSIGAVSYDLEITATPGSPAWSIPA